MGGGVSSLHHLRKVLVIRAYNSRPSDVTTVSSQFLPFRKVNPQTGCYFTPASSLCSTLKIESPNFLSEILTKCGLENMMNTPLRDNEFEVDFNMFIAFIETGAIPTPKPSKPSKKGKGKQERRDKKVNASNMSSSSSTPDLTFTSYTTSLPTTPESSPNRSKGPGSSGNRGAGNRGVGALPPLHPPSSPKSLLPPTMFLSSPERKSTEEDKTRTVARSDEAIYPGVWRALGYSTLTRCRSMSKFTAKVLRPGFGRPLWKKQETVIQERIVKYVTVEPDGTVQTLIECQKDMTEVTHMECKDSGEFAHRETTEYEQTETFNDELVMAERGEEKYVHMKSKNDEYEHMESHMPRKEREAAEQERTRMEMEAQVQAEKEAREQLRAEIEEERAKMVEEGFDPDDPQFQGKFALPAENLSLREELEMERERLFGMNTNPDDPRFEGRYSLPPDHYPDDLLKDRRELMQQGIDPDDPQFEGKYTLPDEPDLMGRNECGPGGNDCTPVGPMGMKLGDPAPPGLTEEEAVWWAGQQRALLEEQYMQDMIKNEGGGEEAKFFDDEDLHLGEGKEIDGDDFDVDEDFAYQLQKEQQRKRQELRQEKRRQSREGLHVPNPKHKEELFGSDDNVGGAAFPSMFGEAKDEENVPPDTPPDANTPEKVAQGKGLAQQQQQPPPVMEFGSPTPSDKAAGLD